MLQTPKIEETADALFDMIRRAVEPAELHTVSIRSTEKGLFFEVYIKGASENDRPVMRHPGWPRRNF